MIKREPRLRTIVRINMHFVVSGLALFYGWLCWQGASPEWWGLGIIAILMFAGGGGMFAAAVVKIVAIVLRNKEIDDFERQGGDARADRMVSERELRDRGMIR